jgi:cellulose synthase/poly-beta-1,6-N-acetylglucosamine synthase-like glycosyltransferase
MDISIVIPVFNESKKIGADIKTASVFLESEHLTREIIAVDDGSDDGTSEAAKNVTTPAEINLEVIRYDGHQGKGYAVRTGIKKTSGDYVMFADSGCCVPYGYVPDGTKLLKSGAYDIVHGSKKLRESKVTIRLQDIPGRCREKLIRAMCHGWFYVRRGNYNAGRKAGLPHKRISYRWTCDRDSQLSPARSLWRVLRELITIKRTLAKENAG